MHIIDVNINFLNPSVDCFLYFISERGINFGNTFETVKISHSRNEINSTQNIITTFLTLLS